MEMRKLVRIAVLLIVMMAVILGLVEVGEARPLHVLESPRGGHVPVPATGGNPCTTIPHTNQGICTVKHMNVAAVPLSRPPPPPHFAAN